MPNATIALAELADKGADMDDLRQTVQFMAQFLTGHDSPEAIARFYRDLGAKLVVVKLGPEGAWYDGEAGCGHVPGFAVERVVSALLEGAGVADAVRRGAWIGARAVQVLGDTEGLPTRAQLQEASYSGASPELNRHYAGTTPPIRR